MLLLGLGSCLGIVGVPLMCLAAIVVTAPSDGRPAGLGEQRLGLVLLLLGGGLTVAGAVLSYISEKFYRNHSGEGQRSTLLC
jgi:hypothetical protein